MPTSKTDSVKTYANSLARYRFLQTRFSSKHPTCEAEYQLLEMNEASLRLEILEEYTSQQVQAARPAIERRIIQFMLLKLQDVTDDDSLITRIMRNVKSTDFDSLFTFHS